MDLQNEAIELQKVFHQDYKTYWEETEAIKAHLEARFKALGLYDVSKCYTEKDMDNAYDKGFKDGNQRDLTGSLIEVL
jgi:hypothetical protein